MEARFYIALSTVRCLQQFLAQRREEIELEQLIVLFVDECHLVWGDICKALPVCFADDGAVAPF